MVVVAVILVLVGVIAYIGYQNYQTTQFNDHFKKADALAIAAKSQTTQTDYTSKSIETNIQLYQNASNQTDQAIEELNASKQYSPDNATTQYLDLRIQQFQEYKNWQEILIATYEKIKTDGILAGAASINENKIKTDEIKQKIDDYQNQIISIVNNNPRLKQHRIELIGQQRADQGLKPYDKNDNSNAFVYIT